MLGCSGQDGYGGNAVRLIFVTTAAVFDRGQRIVEFGTKCQVSRDQVGKRACNVIVFRRMKSASPESRYVVEWDGRVAFGPGVTFGQNVLVAMVNRAITMFM